MKIEAISTPANKPSYHSHQVNKFIEDNNIKVIKIDNHIVQGFQSSKGVYEPEIVTTIIYEEES